MPRLNMSSRDAIAVAVLLCIGAFAARAQGDVVERQVKAAPGHDARIGVFTDIRPDCTSGPLPTIRLATPPAHGAVTVKRATLKATNVKQCLALEVPALVAFYRAVSDFSGPDVFELEISMQGGRKQRERVQVMVTKSPGSGQGI